MLLGEVVYKVGQKHRLALPKKFRQILGDRLIVTRGYEGCLTSLGVIPGQFGSCYRQGCTSKSHRWQSGQAA